jgi:hypothetical protein
VTELKLIDLSSWADVEIPSPPAMFYDVYRVVRDFVISLPNYTVDNIPRQVSGVYFIFDGSAFEYVGKSVDIKKRISQHVASGLVCKYDRIYIRETKYIDTEEVFFIMTLMPNKNRSVGVGSLHQLFSYLFWNRPLVDRFPTTTQEDSH